VRAAFENRVAPNAARLKRQIPRDRIPEIDAIMYSYFANH
jgi:hypothetical protein